MSDLGEILYGLTPIPIGNILEFVKNIEKLEGKPLGKWSDKQFLRYFNKLRSRKFPSTVLLNKEDYKTIHMLKLIHQKCKSVEELKDFIDNAIINWEAIKEKHYPAFKTAEYPVMSILLYYVDKLIEDLRTTKWTYSRSHRISPLDKDKNMEAPW